MKCKNNKHISLFEYDKLTYDNSDCFTKKYFEIIQKYYGNSGVPYFDLIHKGIRFKHYVGVIRIGNLTIEVLPKADKDNKDINNWRKFLIAMLLQLHKFNKINTGTASLQLKQNSILDLYFELFIIEVENLLQKGLIKKYRKKDENLFSLKGNLLFSKNFKENLIHKERFYTRYTSYDKNHLLHHIIYQTLLVLKQINTNQNLIIRINRLLTYFYDLKKIKINESTFDKIIYNSKSKSYKNSIDISRLILLNYHPDIIEGSNEVISLMFDMNKLWEEFIFISLKKYLPDYKVKSQQSKKFWQDNKTTVNIRPDIVISNNNETYVIDTKWKMIEKNDNERPNDNDLKQLFVYNLYFNSSKVALLYPGSNLTIRKGKYNNLKTIKIIDKECSIIKIPIDNIKNTNNWQKEITEIIYKDWIKKVR